MEKRELIINGVNTKEAAMVVLELYKRFRTKFITISLNDENPESQKTSSLKNGAGALIVGKEEGDKFTAQCIMINENGELEEE